MRVPLAVVLGFFFLVMLSTLSRSGLLGLIVGLLVLAIPYRRRLVSRALLVPLGAVAALLVAVVWSRRHYFEVLLKSRVQTGGGSRARTSACTTSCRRSSTRIRCSASG